MLQSGGIIVATLLQKYISVNFIGHLKRFDDSSRSCYSDELPNHHSSLVFAVPYAVRLPCGHKKNHKN